MIDNEQMFYLLNIIYEKFSEYLRKEHKFMLIDLWQEEFEKILKDFNEHDNTNIGLLDSVYDYVNLNYDKIKEVIDKCCESDYLTF